MPSVANREDLAHFAVCSVAIDGGAASAEFYNDLLECQVENSLHLPDSCLIRLADEKFEWAESSLFEAGKQIVVSMGTEAANAKPVFTGEIVGYELDMSASSIPTMVIRCFDLSHRLQRGRHTRVFTQMTDSDIVTEVALQAGFVASVEATTGVHQWVMQRNQSDWDFLRERARLTGRRMWVSGRDIFNFQTVKPSDGNEIEVKWGQNLLSFRPRVLATPPVESVTVRGWSQRTKTPYVEVATTPQGLPQVGEAKPSKASSAFGPAPKIEVVSLPVHQPGEAKQLAQAVCNDIGGEMIEAEGLIFGNADLRPGSRLRIDNIGKRFKGTYYVTATTHTYSLDGYTTVFSATAGSSNTLADALFGGTIPGGPSAAGGGGNGITATFDSVVVGLVTNNNDPQNRGRVKVKFPWLGDNTESHWARIAAPMAGKNRGFYFLPEVDDEVLVAFEHGDMRRPYIVGALWNEKDTVVEPNNKATSGGKTEHRIIKTRVGHTLLFDEKRGIFTKTQANNHLDLNDAERNILAKTTDGHLFVMDDAKKRCALMTTGKHFLILHDDQQFVRMESTNGHYVQLDDHGGQGIKIQDSLGNRVVIKTSTGAIEVSGSGDINIEAGGKLTMRAQLGIDLITPAKILARSTDSISVLSDSKVEIEGTAGASVASKARVEVEGSAGVSVASPAMVEVKGAMVKIN